MNINIESIPHASHRYPTCGDWWTDTDGTLQIRVSEEIPKESQQLVILHELAEVIMCQANGVPQESVDTFDKRYEADRLDGDESEPGDSPLAPYHVQHSIATAIERIVAAQMGIPWMIHDNSVGALP
jgi:hypothetical protein